MKLAARSFHFTVGLVLLLALSTTTAFAAKPHCSQIGGMILTNLGGFGVDPTASPPPWVSPPAI